MNCLPLIAFFSGYENAAGKFEVSKIMIWRFKITESPRSPYMAVHGLIKGSGTDKIPRDHEENLTRKNNLIELSII